MSPAPRIQRVKKRDGREVPFDRAKIESAVARAESAAGDPRPGFASEIGDLVEHLLERRFPDPGLAIPGIEDIQDLVERALVEMGAATVNLFPTETRSGPVAQSVCMVTAGPEAPGLLRITLSMRNRGPTLLSDMAFG